MQPDVDTVTQFATVFDVSVERMIYGKGKPHFQFAEKFTAASIEGAAVAYWVDGGSKSPFCYQQ